MAATFDAQNEVVQEHFARIKELIPSLARAETAEQKDAAKVANNEIQRLQREVDKALRAMEAEARGSAPSQRRALQDTIARSKEEHQKLRVAVQKANDDAARAELMRGTSPAAKAAKLEADARDKAVATAETASRGTGKLRAAAAVVAETQDIGINVIDTMQQQRESLIRSTDKAGDVTSLTGMARNVMLTMQRRAITNKFLLGGAVLILLALIGVVVYFGYIK